LAAAAAVVVGGRPEDATSVGLALELLHTATLVHDDMIDRDRLRRHRPSVWAAHGDPVALLTGDLLIFRSFEALFSSAGDREHVRVIVSARLLSQCGAELCRGEAAEAALVGRPDATLGSYLEVCGRKTGTLLAATCALGALAGGGTPDQVRRLGRLGFLLGYVYQMRDDLLPYVASSADTGKDATSDARQRRATLPVIIAWQCLAGAGREELRRLLSTAELDEADRHAGLTELLTSCGALTKTRRMVVAGGRQAMEVIDRLPAGPARQVFDRLVEHLAGAAIPTARAAVAPAAVAAVPATG
jgi:geranylgeranyl diphosphate synthase type I